MNHVGIRWAKHAWRGMIAAASTLALVAPLMTAQAGEVRFDGEGHAYHPVWSLDGKHVAFEVNRYAGDIDLFIAEITGDIAKDPQKIALPGGSGFGKGQVVINPSWHPQGIAVFEGSNQGGQMRLYFAQPGGASTAEMLSTSKAPGHLTFPAISPNGQLLAFVSNQTGNGDIYSWDRSTDKLSQLTSQGATESFPLYSADGSKMLFTRKQNDTEDVFELTVGAGEAEVAAGNGDQSRPVYGADNRIVYFSSERGPEHWDIYSVDGPGGAKTSIAQDVRLPLRARSALSPDKQWVAYVHDDPTKNMNIQLSRIDGSKTVTIPTEFTACGEPAITQQGDRTLLAFTALPSSDSAWRFLYVLDITDKL